MTITLDDIQKSIHSMQGEIQSIRSEMATKQDIGSLEQKLGNTQQDLKSLRSYLAENVAMKEDIKRLSEDMDEKFAAKKEVRNYATAVEKAMGELYNIRLEQAGMTQRHDDLKKDVSQIQSIPTIAHQLKKS